MTTASGTTRRTSAPEGGRRLRYPDLRRLGEDWELVLLGFVTVLVVVILGATALVTAQGRDTSLRDGSATESRHAVENSLSVDLIKLQEDEVTLFQDQVDYESTRDPAADLHQVQADLRRLRNNPSTLARDDMGTITDQLPEYTQRASKALIDNQQGLPVGAGYLRDAFSELRGTIIPKAIAIRKIDEARLTADDADADGFPYGLVIASALALAVLAAAQVVLARRTRRLLNPGLLAAGALVLVLVAWSVSAVAVSAYRVEDEARPQAGAAVDLATALDSATQVNLDDQLTLADHGEDCELVSEGPDVTCIYEQDALAELGPRGKLATNLATAAHSVPDPGLRGELDQAGKIVGGWRSAEEKMPTLQNVTTAAVDLKSAQGTPRYSTDRSYDDLLDSYVKARGAQPPTEYRSISRLTGKAPEALWARYLRHVQGARGSLRLLAPGGLLLGLLAGAATVCGVGWRVFEYWSRGGSGA